VIEVQFRRILAHKISVAEQILAGLVKSGQMRATPADQCMIRILALRSRARGRPTPSIPYVRVRIRRFGGLSIHVLHGWQTQTTEVSFGEGPVQGFAEADPPRTLGAEDSFARQPFGDA
jgi:hypothetical protein